jgi:GT2 family glycosyltransferase
LILVDNTGSYNVPTCKNLHAVFRNETNIGYAAANNQGAKAATTDVLLLLNCDAIPDRLDWLSELMTAFDDPDVAAAGPKLVHPDGSVQTTGIRTWHGNGSAGGEERKDEHPTEDVDGVTGACMAIRKTVFDSVGGLCDLYWQGYEDVDLCLTLREAGHRIRYVSSSVVKHWESATDPVLRWAHAGENVTLMNQRWGNR